MTATAPGSTQLLLEQLSPSSRIWVFGSSGPLDSAQEQAVEAGLREFLRSWKAHGQPLRAAVEIREHRFVIVAADDGSDPSGCSIDSLFGRLSSFQKLGANLLDSTLVFYRTNGGEVRSVDRASFRQLAAAGEINARTRVFDLTSQTLAELRSGLEKDASASWHGQAFKLL